MTMTTARAKLLFPVLIAVLGCGACDAILGVTDVPTLANGEGEGGSDGESPVVDGSADAHVVVPEGGGSDTGSDATTDGGTNVTTDAGDATAGHEDAGPVDVSWAQWPMPNSPTDVSAGAPNPESYSTPTNGTVVDNVTGLVWQQAPAQDAGTYSLLSWADANAYCANLDLAGEHDWRLPSVIELVSIVQFDVFPTIRLATFPGETGNDYWSSTPEADDTSSEAWLIYFGSGSVAPYPQTQGCCARCVRGGAGAVTAPNPFPVDRYATTDGGAAATVHDARTNLTWQQTPTSDGGAQYPTMSHSDAVSYCEHVQINGAPARLPTIGELLTLVDYTYNGNGEAIDPTAFPTAPSSGSFWSSSLLVNAGPAWFWGVIFDDGQLFADGPPDAGPLPTYYVRCVR